ncbi:MAG TPA: glycosyltransferase, partial [Thermoguttaceae bacterium]|nr:glycosyltransferase [Thermoguttaceae bacterium]
MSQSVMATNTHNSVELTGATHIDARVSRHIRRKYLRGRSTKPLAILHVHGRMGRGGAEMRTIELFRNIDREKYRFHFCATSGSAGELDDEIRALGGHVHRMPQQPIGFSRRLRQLIRQHEFDVVHSHLHFYSGYLLKLAAECNVP